MLLTWVTNPLSVEGSSIKITTKIKSKAINKMKAGNAAGPSVITIEMTKAANNGIIDCITSLFSHIFTREECQMTNIYHTSSVSSKEN